MGLATALPRWRHWVAGEPPLTRIADAEQIAAARKKAANARAAAVEAAGEAAAAGATAAAPGDGGWHGARAVDVQLSLDTGKLPYTPITLVFQDLR